MKAGALGVGPLSLSCCQAEHSSAAGFFLHSWKIAAIHVERGRRHTHPPLQTSLLHLLSASPKILSEPLVCANYQEER